MTFEQADAQIHPFDAGRLRRRHQPHRRHVLRRPRRRVHQHRPCPAPGGRLRARDLAAAGRQRVDPRDLRRAGRRPGRVRAPPPDAPARSRCPTPTGCARSCSPARVRRHRARRRPTRGHVVRHRRRRRPPVRARPRWAGCSKASTTPAARRALDAPATPRWPPTRRPTACSSGRRPGSSGPPGRDRVAERPRSGSFSASTPTRTRRRSIAALDEQASIPAIQRLRAAATELLGLRLGHRVVDVGCGTGDVARALAGLVGADGPVVGIDPSATMLDRSPTPASAPPRFRSSSALGDIIDARPRRRHVRRCTCASASSSTSTRPTRPWPSSCASPDPAGGIVVIDTDWGMHAIHGADPDLTARIVDPGATTPPTGCRGGSFRRCSPTPACHNRSSSPRRSPH